MKTGNVKRETLPDMKGFEKLNNVKEAATIRFE
jgi:hypothetical protein